MHSQKTSKLNVLITADKVGYDGQIHGPGRSFLNIVSNIDKERFNVIPCVLRRKDSLASIFDSRRIKVTYLERGEFDPLLFFDLLKLIRNENIHVVHLNGYRSSIVGRLAKVFTGVPTIVHARGPTDFYGWNKNNNYLWYQQALDWFLAKYTDLVIAVSKGAKDAYILKRKIDQSKVVVMPNRISLEEFHPIPIEQCKEVKRRLGLEQDHLIVGTVTRFIEVKGTRYFLEAAADVLKILPKTYFLIVGEGPLLQELQEISQKLKVDKHVIFTGFYSNIPEIVSIFDIKVLSSLSEGSPNALLEAMAMGKPIVATDVEGINEVLKDNETGLLVPPRDPQTMAEKIIYLLQHEHKRQRFGIKAYQESRRYTLDTYIKDLEGVYENVARKQVSALLPERNS